MTQLIKHIFYPAVLLITLLATIMLVNFMDQSYYLLIPGLVTIPLVLLFVLLEHLMPYESNWKNNKGDFGSDLIRTFFILPIASKLGELLMVVLLYFLLLCAPLADDIVLLTNDWGLALNFIIALLLSEFCYYWMHRITHKSNFLWRFHTVHHGAERVYWANSGRFHFLDGFLGGIAYFLPVVILGPSPEVIVLLLTVSSITGILEHVNIDFKAGFLNYILNTAELHRWHHSPIEKESNSNYGKVLIVWDLIFGTFFWPKQRMLKSAGIENEKIPSDFISQGLYPYRKQAQKK